MAPAKEESKKSKNRPRETVRYVVSDTRAVDMLRRAKECSIVAEEQEVAGYELYIVEQWACERRLTASITTYTGNLSNRVTVSIVEVPKDCRDWSAATFEYFDELVRLHMRPKETDFGVLFVTNLSSFPSNLSLVPVPDGRIASVWRMFYVNENLKRSGCGGRMVLSIKGPSNACEDKFRQVFRTNDKVPIDFAVIELVTLVQIGLFYTGLLSARYVDGLLCDETLRALARWWDSCGQLRYHTRPKDGGFGPTTVAAVVGLLAGVRVRLASVVKTTPKDPFDAEAFVEAIRQFQKHEHLPRSMKIDELTLERLYALTERSGGATAEFLGMVKSTMKEVSGRPVQNVADCETLDLEKLKLVVQGYRARFLWLGKGCMRNRTTRAGFGSRTGIPLQSLDVNEQSAKTELKRTVMRTMAARQKSDDRVGEVEDDADTSVGGNSSTAGSVGLTTSSGTGSTTTTQSSTTNGGVDEEKSRRGRMRLRRLMNLQQESGSRSPSRLGSRDAKTPVILAGVPKKEEPPEHIERAASKDSVPGEEGGGEVCQIIRRVKSLSKLNCDATADAKRIERYQLRRQHSFSLVEDVVNSWTVPFEMCPVRAGYLCGSSRRFQHQLKQQVKSLEAESDVYDQVIKKVGSSLDKEYHHVEKLNEQLEGATGGVRAVSNEIHELETIAARLQYESRMLEAKMRDVEEALSTFESKLGQLESRAEKSMCCPTASTVHYVKSLLNWMPSIYSLRNGKA
ncbi:protein Stb6p [Trichomonascus vanleenenianus]|uniref:protein Stb6p n=1 Tax=Trichomonascus vanleenenianus TaxID=2268995 RepID=UPI003ECA650A